MKYKQSLCLLAVFFLSGCASLRQSHSSLQEGDKRSLWELHPVPVQTISLKERHSNVLVGPDSGQAVPDENAYCSKRSIFFPFDGFQIERQYEPVILAHVHYLQAHPNEKMRIVGNTDERGSSGYNLSLGQKRANVIREAFVQMGISADRVEAVSFGKEKPKALGHDEKSWSENRRSDLLYKSLGEF